MAERIYHLNESGQLEPMIEEQFALEDKLQELVANHPELLSGEQISPDNPRRWILIKRERGIPRTPGGPDHWAIDHLLIDQDAIPTLVETKRSANPEIRRTIVGQMLDYAAHARHTWNAQAIRKDFEESATADRLDPDDMLAEFLRSDGESDSDAFWQQVETNLKAARLRLLFVADGIPDELTRVVEFLNEQMPGIEVLAVEIKQFLGATGKTLVPRVIGRTAAAPVRPPGANNNINRDEFLNQLPSPEIKEAALRLLETQNRHNNALFRWGKVGVTINGYSPAWPNPLTVARLYLPGQTTWPPLRDFTFGTGNGLTGFLDSLPQNLRDLLENWVNEFSLDDFATYVSASGVQGWAISHEDAAANIDVLVERMDKVLRSLQNLEAPQE